MMDDQLLIIFKCYLKEMVRVRLQKAEVMLQMDKENIIEMVKTRNICKHLAKN